MALAIGRVGYEDRLSVVAHLEELRVRLIVALAAITVAFALCLWQNHALLRIINTPLVHETQKQVRAGNGPLGAAEAVQRRTLAVAEDLEAVVATLERPGSGVSAAARASLRGVMPGLQRARARLAASPGGDRPVTLGIGEPFTTTLGVALLFALVLALPVLLYQLYSFVLPAFSPRQQRAAMPLMLAIPLLFAAGVCFGYFVVLPAAVRFFQNFNSGEFDVLVQASQYYHFAAFTLLAMGTLFQIPVGILAATRAGVVSAGQLRHNRRYALLACGLVAAFLPGDAITLVLETVPLYLLFELSVLIARIAERREARLALRPAAEGSQPVR
jgi:sec-independent protein translocase protein TatC